MRPNVLIIDDEHNFREFLGEALETEGYGVQYASTGRMGLASARKHPPRFILLDQNLPDGSGLDLLPQLQRQRIHTSVIVITAYAEFGSAVDAVKAGAFHYLSKPLDFGRLLEILSSASSASDRSEEHESSAALAAMIGESPAMMDLKARVRRIARGPAESILVHGESGTGKELVAQALHQMSDRADGRLVSVNCAALTETLLMSELFGHERGAFTDAREQRKGVFEAAQGGTLFLDEVGEMGPRSQAALLRALEQRVIRRVGGTVDVPIDIRVVAATNRDLSVLVANGSFREDLYYRLNVVDIQVPPLRARGDDVLLLARHFSETLAQRYREQVRSITPDAAARLREYSWPGNVRELRNYVERGYAATTMTTILAGELGSGTRVLPLNNTIASSYSPGTSFQQAKQEVVDAFERSFLESALLRAGGNVTQAAADAGLIRQVLQRLVRRHGIDPDDYRH
ncbi:MAG TPA: sigma-54 dependent transcriptional regulator [Longimicrobiales bacterium]|nr:sigma-54 dependent transcriptional regulator [Longimicrobiales bacterium]